MKYVAGILFIRKLTKHIYNSRIIFPYWMKQLQPIYTSDVFRMVLITTAGFFSILHKTDEKYLQQQEYFPSFMLEEFRRKNLCCVND
jgi:hypothetical protein